MDQTQIITAATSVFTTFVGTWFGARVIIQRQEARRKYPRKLMLKVLNSFKKYETYQNAENEFNIHSVFEKKAVIIAMKNLGVPLIIDVINDSYDLTKVRFYDDQVIKESIDQMIGFVKNGLCDDLFFNEIGENLYNVPPKIIFARNLAIRFLDTLVLQPATATLAHVIDKAEINLNQFQIIQVFCNTVDFTESSKVSEEKIKLAKANIRNGVFDNLFYWDMRAFENMNSQRNAADAVALQLNKKPAIYPKTTAIDTATSS